MCSNEHCVVVTNRDRHVSVCAVMSTALLLSTETDMQKTAKTEGATLVDVGSAETGTKKRAVARKSISKPTPIIVHDITDDTEDELPVEVQEQEQEEVKRKYCVTQPSHTTHGINSSYQQT